MALPSDLLQFWELTGGGDVFDSETILRPTVLTPPNAGFVEDEVERCNKWAVREGMAPDLYVFHRGAFFSSAIRLSDYKYVTLSGGGFTIMDTFDSFDDWYVHGLRILYADLYRLAPVDEVERT